MGQPDVLVIGGGPAGLACATALAKAGVRQVLVAEREAEAGGVPRHAGHWGFGLESHGRLMRGPAYAARLLAEARAAGVTVATGTTVARIEGPGRVVLHDKTGLHEVVAGRVVLATGAREGTRAERLIGGARHPQIMTTGTLQQMVYLKGMVPFRRPLILGAEWVSYSAILTCRHAGIRPVALLDEGQGGTDAAPRWFAPATRLAFAIPTLRRISDPVILGRGRVEAVRFTRDGRQEELACDGVIISGRFRPEASLLAGLACPPGVILAGNVTGPLKTAGGAAMAGRGAARQILGDT